MTAPTFITGYTPSLAEQIDTDIFPEIVIWIVVDEPLVVSEDGEDEISAFRALFPERMSAWATHVKHIRLQCASAPRVAR